MEALKGAWVARTEWVRAVAVVKGGRLSGSGPCGDE